MTNNIELLSQYDNFTIGTNSNLTEILANVVKVGRALEVYLYWRNVLVIIFLYK